MIGCCAGGGIETTAGAILMEGRDGMGEQQVFHLIRGLSITSRERRERLGPLEAPHFVTFTRTGVCRCAGVFREELVSNGKLGSTVAIDWMGFEVVSELSVIGCDRPAAGC